MLPLVTGVIPQNISGSRHHPLRHRIGLPNATRRKLGHRDCVSLDYFERGAMVSSSIKRTQLPTIAANSCASWGSSAPATMSLCTACSQSCTKIRVCRIQRGYLRSP